VDEIEVVGGWVGGCRWSKANLPPTRNNSYPPLADTRGGGSRSPKKIPPLEISPSSIVSRLSRGFQNSCPSNTRSSRSKCLPNRSWCPSIVLHLLCHGTSRPSEWIRQRFRLQRACMGGCARGAGGWLSVGDSPHISAGSLCPSFFQQDH
jgi:hypothetical protein